MGGTVPPTLYTLHCTLYTVHCKICSDHCKMFSAIELLQLVTIPAASGYLSPICHHLFVLLVSQLPVLLYYCITVLLYYCITVLLYYSITVLLYYCIAVLLYYCITVLPVSQPPVNSWETLNCLSIEPINLFLQMSLYRTNQPFSTNVSL